MTIRLTLLALLFLLPKVTPAAPPLQLRLNGTSGSETVEVIDLGQLLKDTERRFSIEVTNTTDTPITTGMYTWGSRVEASWKHSQEKPKWARTLSPGETAALEVVFRATNPAEADTQTIYFASKGEVVLLVTFDHLIREEPRVTIRHETTGYNSGFGKDFSDFYTVCLGPAPFGYTFESHTFETEQVPANFDKRACGHFVDCDPGWQILGDQDVCRRFKIQGREAKNAEAAKSVEAKGILTATYRLIESAPTLVKPAK